MTSQLGRPLRFMQTHFFYEHYLDHFYRTRPHLQASTFQNQISSLVDDGFSGIHIIAPHMHKVGYEGFFSVANDPLSQSTWLKESGAQLKNDDWTKEIVRMQVEQFKPDVLYLSEPLTLESNFIRSLTYRPKLIIGWRAANIPDEIDWSEFDVILSSLKGIRQVALELGAKSVEHFWPGFPLEFYSKIESIQPTDDVMFCGQWTERQHPKRNALITKLAEEASSGLHPYKLVLYLSGELEKVPPQVMAHHCESLYGMRMFEAIRRAKMTFDARGNIGIDAGASKERRDLAKKETANMRIFEATGCGRLLLTEHYDNIAELFELGTEIVTYRTEKELIEKIQYYTKHQDEAREIAERGRVRCHKEHSMENRIKKLDMIINDRLRSEKISPIPSIQTHGIEHEVESLKVQALECIENNRLDEAFSILVKAKSYQTPVYGLDHVRALYFYKRELFGDAKQCALEELRHFANNSDSQALLVTIENQVKGKNTEDFSRYEPEFVELLNQIRPYSMLPVERLNSLYQLSKEVCIKDIPGNFVECGVAGGGSLALIASVVQRYSIKPRTIYACDSYEGMPEPSEHDILEGVEANATGWGVGTCAAPEDSVLEIATKMGVRDNIVTVKGYFEESLPREKNKIGSIAFLHIDCDWYSSTKTVLDEIYDQLSSDGYCQIDDYGYWEGMKKVFDEFQAERSIALDITSIDGMSAWFKIPTKSVSPEQVLDEVMIHVNEGREHDAIDILKRSDQALAALPELGIVAAVAYKRMGEMGSAKQFLEDVLRKCPEHSYAKRLLDEIGNDTEIVTVKEEIRNAASATKDVNLLIDNALQFLKTNETSKAHEEIQQAISLDERVRDLHYVEAICHLQIGNESAGVRALEREVSAFPDNIPAKELLNDLQRGGAL